MTKWLLAAALVLTALPSSVMAQSKKSLVGTWTLVSAKTTSDKGAVQDMYGPNPTGFLTYTTDGRMSVIVADSRRKPLFSSGAPAAEAITEAFSSFTAYAGSYTVTGDRVTHHIEVSSYQDFVNTDEMSSIEIQGDRLTLRAGQLVDRATSQPNSEIIWERMKPKTTTK